MKHSSADSLVSANSLAAENQALRAHIRRLEEQQAASATQQPQAAGTAVSQERFRTVFENSPLGHKIIDADLIIRQANLALVAMLGLSSPAELVGRRIMEFAHPHHRYDWQQLQERLWMHKLPTFSLETCLIRPDGSSFWAQVTSVLFDEGEAQMGYTTIEDISERKEAEAALQRLYDAQETVLHLIAHDLRSPLANIQLLVEVLQRDKKLLALTPVNTHQETGEFLTMIQRSCIKAHALLQDVLYLGRLDAKRLEKHPTDLNAFLAERLLGYYLLAQQQGIELALDLPDQVVQVALHPDKFGRVLDNLLTNALKFTPSGGRVSVRLAEVGGHPRIVVRDTGVGIPAALQASVFDKFSAATRVVLYDSTTTGLGLFITKEIVQLHGGKIWLKSRENEGTTFFIELV
jgi:two-component system sensor histidine kinase VicK